MRWKKTAKRRKEERERERTKGKERGGMARGGK